MTFNGRFGEFGGTYVPEILLPALAELEKAFFESESDPLFRAQYLDLLRKYAGRPTPLYRCRNIAQGTKATIYLKREDLVHGGAHKTNQVIGQALLAKGMGKKRLIAETGAGQHGVATAIAGALFNLETVIYMGAKDIARQELNVFRMQLLGAQVISVRSGSQTLKDAINEALRDWSSSYESTHYLLGTVAGPHPYPIMVRQFQRIIGDEARNQILEEEGRLPDSVVACVGGGSNAMGIFSGFVNDKAVELIGVEPAGEGIETTKHGATLMKGAPGILHGAYTKILQNEDGQILDAHSVSAGLDYPGVGPEHAFLKESKRANYVCVKDEEALEAFVLLSKAEGIIPAFESAHALAYAVKMANEAVKETVIVVNISGRGDKDMVNAQKMLSDKMMPVQVIGEAREQ